MEMCQCNNKNNATANLLHDLRVILLGHSVKQEAGHVRIHPWTFVAGAEVIWMTVKIYLCEMWKHIKTQSQVKNK